MCDVVLVVGEVDEFCECVDIRFYVFVGFVFCGWVC